LTNEVPKLILVIIIRHFTSDISYEEGQAAHRK